jgi:DEAD/DEAH box helicase domain-containing protein
MNLAAPVNPVDQLKPQELDLRDIPVDLPPELVEALHAQGIRQFYSHQLKALQAIRAGKSLRNCL